MPDNSIISAFAPGRVELLGNHTDYNEGLVIGAAIDRGLKVAGATRADRLIQLKSSLMGEFEIALENLRPQPRGHWANYALGVVSELIELGVAVSGFSAAVEGNLPPRSGLSSSAAFEVATALFLLKLHRTELPPMDVAKLCQRAEHRFANVRSGLLDQVMSIFGRANHLVFFDARSEEVRQIPFPPRLGLIIAESGTERELSRGDYNLRREETSAAARALGLRALRDISLAELNKRTDLDPLLRRRAAHVVGENDRVQRALVVLASGDAAEFGALMNASHESSRFNFENSTPELDLLVELARQLPGVLGARLTGAGFGGAAVILCERSRANNVAERLRSTYRAKTGIASPVFVCEIADGAACLT